MKIKPNYIETCICGDKFEEFNESQTWRFITWSCKTCGRTYSTQQISDAPHRAACLLNRMFKSGNANLREEKGLEFKKTICKVLDNNGNRLTWKQINKENKEWKERVGAR